MKRLFDPLTSMVVTLAGIAGVSIIAIAMQNVWGFVIGIALGLGLVFGGILRYRAGDLEVAKLTCLVVTVAGIVLGFISLFLRGANIALGVVNLLIVIPTGWAWYVMQSEG
jgi:hypothetical protein